MVHIYFYIFLHQLTAIVHTENDDSVDDADGDGKYCIHGSRWDERRTEYVPCYHKDYFSLIIFKKQQV